MQFTTGGLADGGSMDNLFWWQPIGVSASAMQPHHSFYAREESVFPKHLSDIQNKNYICAWWMKRWSRGELKGMPRAGKAVSDKGKKGKQSFPRDCPLRPVQSVLHLTDAQDLCSLFQVLLMLSSTVVWTADSMPCAISLRKSRKDI